MHSQCVCCCRELKGHAHEHKHSLAAALSESDASAVAPRLVTLQSNFELWAKKRSMIVEPPACAPHKNLG